MERACMRARSHRPVELKHFPGSLRRQVSAHCAPHRNPALSMLLCMYVRVRPVAVESFLLARGSFDIRSAPLASEP